MFQYLLFQLLLKPSIYDILANQTPDEPVGFDARPKVHLKKIKRRRQIHISSQYHRSTIYCLVVILIALLKTATTSVRCEKERAKIKSS